MNLAAAEERLIRLLREEAIDLARKDILPFTVYTKRDYHVGWHHRALCRYLNRFANREIKRLIVTFPPRHGKSELVSRRLPAFLLGRYPDAQVISASYGADLASRMNRDVQRIIDTKEYRDIFPDTRLNERNVRADAEGKFLRNSELFEVVGQKGTYRCAGVGGGITGMGADFLIIDDPIKNQEEADSSVYREKVWEWFASTAYTRLEKEAGVLITLTRWHEDDLAGRLIAQAKADPTADQYVLVNFPAIKEEECEYDPREIGEALWPEKYDLARLNAIKANVGSRVWNALYQQRPAAAEGNIVKRDWLRFWDTLPRQIEEQIISVDATFTGKATSDFVAMQVWGRWGAQKYLLDQRYARMGITDTIHALLALCEKWPDAKLKLIENKANGPAIEDLLKQKVSGIVLWEPNGDKVARMNAVCPQLEAGNVFFPMPARQPWVDGLIDELVSFPNAAHDDRCDALTQALLRLEESCSRGVGTIRVLR